MSGDHISSNRKQLDIEYWRILVWGYSATTFVICSLIFLSGWCLQQNHHAEHNASQLQFISTQMGACLKKHPLVTHFFVLAMAIQMLLLFDAFLRCMKYADCIDNNITVCKCIVVSRQLLVLFCGLLIINLVISIAGVAEFCSEGEHYERIFHYVSAVSTITIFWAIHFLICLYLRGFAHAADYKYNYIRLCYFGLTVLFFFLWILQIFCVVFFELAKIVEWLILLTALVLQCYAEYSLYEHTPKFVNSGRIRCNKIHMDASLVVRSISCTFIFTLVLMIFSAPPWFIHANKGEKNLYTGAEYWGLIITAHVVVTMQLLYASFKELRCANAQYTKCFLDGKCANLAAFDFLQKQETIATQRM